MVAPNDALRGHDRVDAANLTDAFHRLYYESAQRTWKDTTWLGVPVRKCPLDLWSYQELLWRLRPDLVIETGTFRGGSALFLASVLDAIGSGRIVSIDVDSPAGRPVHSRIEYLTGSSTGRSVVERVGAAAQGARVVLVILDSDHRCEHVAEELHAYAPYVSSGSYLIVEDTNLNGNPVAADFGPGPREAVEAFLAQTDAFVVDRLCEKFFLTFNPAGYLRRR